MVSFSRLRRSETRCLGSTIGSGILVASRGATSNQNVTLMLYGSSSVSKWCPTHTPVCRFKFNSVSVCLFPVWHVAYPAPAERRAQGKARAQLLGKSLLHVPHADRVGSGWASDHGTADEREMLRGAITAAVQVTYTTCPGGRGLRRVGALPRGPKHGQSSGSVLGQDSTCNGRSRKVSPGRGVNPHPNVRRPVFYA